MVSRKERKPYAAPALSKGLEILELLAKSAEPMTQGEIARALERSVNEQFRMLAVLEEAGYVRRDEHGAYHPTLKLFVLGSEIPFLETVVSASRGPMREFVETTGQECHLSYLEEGWLIVLTQQMGGTEITLHVRSGTRCNPFQTASGRFLLAELEPDEINWHWRKASHHFPRTMPDRSKAMAQIQNLEGERFSRSRDESLVGLADCSVVFGSRKCRVALASSWFYSAVSKEEETEIEEHLMETGRRIERLLGIGT